jgi:hypothetical protein
MQIYDRLDTIHMSAIDREHAKAHMRSAELTIDFVVAAVKTTRLVSAALGQHLISVARRFQISDRHAVRCPKPQG